MVENINTVPEEKQAADFSSLEVMARMTDTEIDAREICDKWLLITYDLPNNDEGNKMRAKFYIEAKRIGATQHTESVYLMPWTPDAEMLALSLSMVGKCVIWTASVNESDAQEITKRYDEGLRPILKEIETRIDKVGLHIEAGDLGIAQRMTGKTDQMIKDLEQAICRRGSALMLITLMTLKNRWNGVFSRI
ncbi:MAG: hypothetical protein WC554_06080 [Clostridia bacterium]|jgi:hypothetical protein